MPLPGAPRLDNYLPALLRAGLYHADGQQLDEVYVDGSFRQSKMYQKGVACSNCHDVHTRQDRDSRATRSARSATRRPPIQAFASAAGNFDTPAHHFHKAGSAGAQCVELPHAEQDLHADPGAARPQPARAPARPDGQIGTPNACTSCHADRSPQWAAAAVAKWYGATRRQGRTTAKRSPRRAPASRSPARRWPGSRPTRRSRRSSRATALASLRFEPAVGVDERIAATRDADAEVRAAAAESLEGAPRRRSASRLWRRCSTTRSRRCGSQRRAAC